MYVKNSTGTIKPQITLREPSAKHWADQLGLKSDIPIPIGGPSMRIGMRLVPNIRLGDIVKRHRHIHMHYRCKLKASLWFPGVLAASVPGSVLPAYMGIEGRAFLR